jgi:hypothetical protein
MTSYFVKVLDGVVVSAIVAEPSYFDTFVDNSPGQWLQTDINTRGGVHYLPDSNTPSPTQEQALRKNYAGIGYLYDAVRDAFYESQPYPSWTLDDFSCTWVPPIPYLPDPEEGYYSWDETNLAWVWYP